MQQKRNYATFKWLDPFRVYWRLYGGWRAIVQSPYVYVAAIFTLLAVPFWLEQEAGKYVWTETAIAVIPSLLGFSMGGMAIMLAFAGTTAFDAITQKGKPDSIFAKVIANFFHFILFQTVALFSVILVDAYGMAVVSGLSFLLFSYSVLVAIAIAGQLLQTSRIFNAAQSLPKPPRQSDSREAAGDGED